jgi:hypothetical protein
VPRSSSIKEMLLAFLRAELDSPTEAENLKSTLKALELDEELVLGDTADAETLLRLFDAYRGWQDVFDGLDFLAMDWFSFELDLHELRFSTFTCKHHFERRYGTRSPLEVAEVWNRANKPNGVLARLAEGHVFEPPILIGDQSLSKLVILEGHNRLLSYLRSPDQVRFPVATIVGTADNVSRWCQW